MERKIRTQTLTTQRASVDICDKCGLSPDEGLIPLYRDVQTRVHHNLSEEAMGYASEFCRERNRAGQAVRAFTVELAPDEALIEELRDDEPDIEICRGCYDEMVGWSQ